MGGSGGGFLGRADPDTLRDRLRQAEEQRSVQSAQFEAEVGMMIGQVLTDYNDRDVEGVQRILDRVKQELGDEIEGTVDIRFGGSVAKHTYVDGMSDIDALVLMDPKDAGVGSPAELRASFAERLRAHYGRECVTEGRMAVTLTLEGKVLQFLPAVKDGSAYKIGSTDGQRWASIRPRAFAEKLTDANSARGGKLVPTIKLAKGIIGAFPEQRRLSGYHVEAMAVEVFDGYTGPSTPKAMLAHFFEKAPACVKRPMRDVTGQSIHVDDYLGSADSTQRRVVADALDRVARKIKNADGAQSPSQWRELLGGMRGPNE